MSFSGFENLGQQFAPLADAQLKQAYQDYQAQKDQQQFMHQRNQDQAALLRAAQDGPVDGIEDVEVDPMTADIFQKSGLNIQPGQKMPRHVLKAAYSYIGGQQRIQAQAPVTAARVENLGAQTEALKNKPAPKSSYEDALLIQLKDPLIALDPDKSQKILEELRGLHRKTAAPKSSTPSFDEAGYKAWLDAATKKTRKKYGDTPANREAFAKRKVK